MSPTGRDEPGAGDAPGGLRIDHVVYAVRDLDAAGERFRRELGLDSVPGGRHPGWGTANRIVPLGDDYVELIAVADAAVAARSAFGRWMVERVELGDGPATLCAAADDLEGVARRLDLDVHEGRRERPDGTELRWRSAGLEDARREPWMPFFIAWEVPPELHPGRARAGHGVRPTGISWVSVAGDADRLLDWLGGSGLPIRIAGGAGAVKGFGVGTADGELVID